MPHWQACGRYAAGRSVANRVICPLWLAEQRRYLEQLGLIKPKEDAQ